MLCGGGWKRFFSVALLAQGAQPPAFEVASIKETTSDSPVRGGAPQPGRFLRTSVTLRQLIQTAYSRRAFDQREISGGPSWIDSARFDVEGKFGDNGEPGLAYLMVRTLLADRFKLALHTESREIPVYALELARRAGRFGPQLRRSDEDCAVYLDAVMRIGGRQPSPPREGHHPPCSIASVSPYAARVVLDRTGLSGVFDFSLSWTPTPGEHSAAVPFDHADPLVEKATSLFTALAAQLGMKLVSTHGIVDVLVIDRLEKPTKD